MKRIVLLVMGIILLNSYTASAQAMPTSTYKKINIKNRKPIPYTYVSEANIMWSKLVWRIIDLRQKINQPFFYPIKKTDDRYSLVDLLLYGIENEGLTAFDTEDDEFKVPITLDQIKVKFGAINDTISQRNNLTGEMEEKIIAGEMHTDEVKRFLIKEQWFFDRQTSTLQVRIIGLCPIREYYKDEDEDRENIQRKKLFWVYFPEARPLLASHEVFNTFNDAARNSFDDIFLMRRFSSFISQISNVHNNRSISEYTKGINVLLESKRIENEIRKFEHDLWEY